MSDIFGGPGDQVRGPSGVYSRSENLGKSDVKPSNVVDPPGGLLKNPAVRETREAQAAKKEAGESSGPVLTWEERALRLLGDLVLAKGYKGLSPKLRAEIRELIENAPESARL